MSHVWLQTDALKTKPSITPMPSDSSLLRAYVAEPVFARLYRSPSPPRGPPPSVERAELETRLCVRVSTVSRPS